MLADSLLSDAAAADHKPTPPPPMKIEQRAAAAGRKTVKRRRRPIHRRRTALVLRDVNMFTVRAPPRTLLGELTALHRPLAGFGGGEGMEWRKRNGRTPKQKSWLRPCA